MVWVAATATAALQEKKRILFRQGKKQISLFQVGDDCYAVDNRCPHEGYPLMEGTVDGPNCRLTCQWHNWQFDLKTGKALLGEDSVRVYPTRTEGDQIWVDLTEPSKDEIRASVMSGFREAFDRRQYGRMSREITRLVMADIDPMVVVREAAANAYDRMERGLSHAWAATADWLSLYRDAPDREHEIMYLTEAVDHFSHDVLQEQPLRYPYPEGLQKFDSEGFRAAIERADEGTAFAMVRGATAADMAWADLEYWFAASALDHYKGFGHAIIYVTKIGRLIEELGPESMLNLLLPLTRYLLSATREDLIPEFRDYAGWRLREPAAFGSGESQADDTPFGLGIGPALQWVSERCADQSPRSLFSNLMEANARNMLHFDTAFEQAYHLPVRDSVDWLDFSHALTMGTALEEIAGRYPDLWYPGLLQLACFTGRNKRYVDPDLDVSEWRVVDAEAFFTKSIALLSDHGLNEPIYACHLLKTALAVRRVVTAVSPEAADTLLAALNRFLHSPIKQKHVRRSARQAMALVSKG